MQKRSGGIISVRDNVHDARWRAVPPRGRSAVRAQRLFGKDSAQPEPEHDLPAHPAAPPALPINAVIAQAVEDEAEPGRSRHSDRLDRSRGKRIAQRLHTLGATSLDPFYGFRRQAAIGAEGLLIQLPRQFFKNRALRQARRDALEKIEHLRLAGLPDISASPFHGIARLRDEIFIAEEMNTRGKFPVIVESVIPNPDAPVEARAERLLDRSDHVARIAQNVNHRAAEFLKDLREVGMMPRRFVAAARLAVFFRIETKQREKDAFERRLGKDFQKIVRRRRRDESLDARHFANVFDQPSKIARNSEIAVASELGSENRIVVAFVVHRDTRVAVENLRKERRPRARRSDDEQRRRILFLAGEVHLLAY